MELTIEQRNYIAWIRYERQLRIDQIQWRYQRFERNARLGLPQVDTLEKLDTYIQALADITKQENFPDVVWPVLEEG